MLNWKSLWTLEEDGPESMVWLRRRETWVGETRANFIRVCALGLFCVNEFLNYHVFHVVDRTFHVGSLLVILIWFLAAILFHGMLKWHWLPTAGSYLTVAVDVLLITWMLFLGDGPSSPLVSVYFLIVALSGSRLSVKLVAFTCVLTVLGYGSAWDFARRQKPECLVSPQHATIVALSLLFAGWTVSSLVRRVFDLMIALEREGHHE